LAPKEITRQELKDLVDEWLSVGNKITMCAEGVALNFRTAEIPKVPRPMSVKKFVKQAKDAKPKQPKKNKKKKK
jgi:predicted peroxiredoxin